MRELQLQFMSDRVMCEDGCKGGCKVECICIERWPIYRVRTIDKLHTHASTTSEIVYCGQLQLWVVVVLGVVYGVVIDDYAMTFVRYDGMTYDLMYVMLYYVQKRIKNTSNQ